MVMAALYIVRRPINVWRITASGKAEIIVTYGLPDGADGAGGGTGAGINLLWHQAGHYGEAQGGGGRRMRRRRSMSLDQLAEAPSRALW